MIPIGGILVEPTKRRSWLHQHQAARSLTVAALLVSGALLFVLDNWGWNRALETAIELPVENTLRQSFGYTAPLNSRLKIVLIDDAARMAVGQREFQARDYVKLLQAIKDAGSSAVLLADPLHWTSSSEPGFTELNRMLSWPQVYAGVVTYPRRDGLQSSFPHGRDRFSIATQRENGPWRWQTQRQLQERLRPPHGDFELNSAQLGHLELSDDYRLPLALGREGQIAIPLSFYAAYDLRLTPAKVFVNGKSLPLTDGQFMPLRFDPTAMSDAVMSAAEFLRSTTGGDTKLAPDTIVVLTSNEDYRWVLAQAYAVNSVLQRSWIRQWHYPTSTTVLMVALLMVLFWWLPQRFYFAVGAIATLATFASVSAILTLALQMHVSWLLPLSSGTLLAGLVWFWLSQGARIRQTRLKENFAGLIPENRLDQILHHPGAIRAEASESSVTVMFVDIANFSGLSDTMTPTAVFRLLSNGFEELSECVKQHGGSIDRYLGDGFLAVFGPSLVADEFNYDHADRALSCAIELQHLVANRCVQNAGGEPVFTIRIGINSGSVFFGDIGYGQRLDYTVVGHTVNYAKRFEEACQPFMIIMGPGTKAMLAQFTHNDSRFQRCKITVQGRKGLLDVFECQPFANNQDLLAEARKAYRNQSFVDRHETRIEVPYQINFRLWVNQKHEASLVNYSRNGIGVALDKAFAAKVILRLDLTDQKLRERLQELGIDTLLCEVRWYRHTDSGNLHGLLIKNLSEDQKKRFFEVLEGEIDRQMETLRIAS